MRILMVHNEYAKSSGEEFAARAIGDLLVQRGHEVLWFWRSSARILEGSAYRKIKAFFSGIYSFGSRLEMGRLLDRDGVDLVQVQNLYPLISASVLAPCRRRGVPVVMRCPNYRLFCPSGMHVCRGAICQRCATGSQWWCALRNCEGDLLKSLGYAARNAFARATGIILDNVDVFVVASQFQKGRFVAGGIDPDRVEVVPNLVRASDARFPDEPGELVSFAGRLSPEKGIADLMAAARALPGCPFAVAGDCSAMPGVAATAPGNVAFLGFLSGARLEEFYLRTRILVLPSVWFEGFPNTAGTAMAMGKPVIASRLGALPEIVDDGVTGLLFEPGNAADLAEKIRYLWDRPELCRRMGRAARERAIREWSPDVHYSRLMEIYRKAAAISKPPRRPAPHRKTDG